MTKIQLRLQYFDDIKRFTQIMNEPPVDVDVVSGRFVIDAKSIMGIFSLDLSKPITIVIHADNETIVTGIKDKLKAANIL